MAKRKAWLREGDIASLPYSTLTYERMSPLRVSLSAPCEGTGTPRRLKTRMMERGYANDDCGFAVRRLRPTSCVCTKRRKEASSAGKTDGESIASSGLMTGSKLARAAYCVHSNQARSSFLRVESAAPCVAPSTRASARRSSWP
eukprot:6212439-Pleurochrysis_carterae.AAC.4